MKTILKGGTIILGICAVALAHAGTLTVNVATEGRREGVIAILVFTNKKGFPSKHERAFRKTRIPVTKEGPVACTITNLPYGEYSLSILHDENDNHKADKMLGIGPPKEPVGFTNIGKKLRKQPRFEDTVFTFNARTNEVSVPLFYVF
jgi:uncharacterized protein (DUF2141 family)